MAAGKKKRAGPSKAGAGKAKVRKAERGKKVTERKAQDQIVYADVRKELQSSLLRRLR